MVDKVMALSTAEADAMIEARDRSGCLLSVFHNRRWDWDFLTVRDLLARGELGRPLVIESSVCRYAPPRAWRGSLAAAGTILHDWGAHLVDQALQLGLGPCRRLTAWLIEAPWEGVDSGGHGRIVLEFDGVLFQVESSRICKLDRPRWWIIGTQCGFRQTRHRSPGRIALRAGDIDAASEPLEHQGVLRGSLADGTSFEIVSRQSADIGIRTIEISPKSSKAERSCGDGRRGARGRSRPRRGRAVVSRAPRFRRPLGLRVNRYRIIGHGYLECISVDRRKANNKGDKSLRRISDCKIVQSCDEPGITSRIAKCTVAIEMTTVNAAHACEIHEVWII